MSVMDYKSRAIWVRCDQLSELVEAGMFFSVEGSLYIEELKGQCYIVRFVDDDRIARLDSNDIYEGEHWMEVPRA